MNKQWLAVAMLGAMLSMGQAAAEELPAAEPSTAEAQKSSQKNAACATDAAQTQGDPGAPQNQVEYGGGA
jgi:hypothetical protein